MILVWSQDSKPKGKGTTEISKYQGLPVNFRSGRTTEENCDNVVSYYWVLVSSPELKSNSKHKPECR